MELRGLSEAVLADALRRRTGPRGRRVSLCLARPFSLTTLASPCSVRPSRERAGRRLRSKRVAPSSVPTHVQYEKKDAKMRTKKQRKGTTAAARKTAGTYWMTPRVARAVFTLRRGSSGCRSSARLPVCVHSVHRAAWHQDQGVASVAGRRRPRRRGGEGALLGSGTVRRQCSACGTELRLIWGMWVCLDLRCIERRANTPNSEPRDSVRVDAPHPRRFR
jgi:hypothetical protein